MRPAYRFESWASEARRCFLKACKSRQRRIHSSSFSIQDDSSRSIKKTESTDTWSSPFCNDLKRRREVLHRFFLSKIAGYQKISYEFWFRQPPQNEAGQAWPLLSTKWGSDLQVTPWHGIGSTWKLVTHPLMKSMQNQPQANSLKRRLSKGFERLWSGLEKAVARLEQHPKYSRRPSSADLSLHPGNLQLRRPELGQRRKDRL